MAIAFEMIYVIVRYGKGSKVMQKAWEYGLTGGTILQARGRVHNPILNFLSIKDERKEVVLLATDSQKAKAVIEKLNEKFLFEKKNRGVILSSHLGEMIGTTNQVSKQDIKSLLGGRMYRLITTIVNKGKADKVLAVAREAGSTGVTIINARGSAKKENMKLFNFEIDPEKEIVLIISSESNADKIVASIREKMEIDKLGNGVLFVQEINQAYGIIS